MASCLPRETVRGYGRHADPVKNSCPVLLFRAQNRHPRRLSGLQRMPVLVPLVRPRFVSRTCTLPVFRSAPGGRGGRILPEDRVHEREGKSCREEQLRFC